MSTEIRRVPANWDHPKKENGHYVPLDDSYIDRLRDYKDSCEMFIEHMTTVIEGGSVTMYKTKFTDPKELYEYLTEDGETSAPDINQYMPQGDWYQLFQTISEGTPLSPPFATGHALLEWLSVNKDYNGVLWGREAASHILRIGFTSSMVIQGGKMYQPHEMHMLETGEEPEPFNPKI